MQDTIPSRTRFSATPRWLVVACVIFPGVAFYAQPNAAPVRPTESVPAAFDFFSRQRTATERESISAQMAAVHALRQFQYQFTLVVQNPERSSRKPAGPILGSCEIRVTDFCYGPRNGKLRLGGIGTYVATGFLTTSKFHKMWRRGMDMYAQRYLTELRRLQKIVPGDRWINGELVRISLERGVPGNAEKDLKLCRDESWWCEALSAHVTHSAGAWQAADSMWSNVLARMTEGERCEWLDPTPVIREKSLRDSVEKMTCSNRIEFATRFWWLSDPLYTRTNNERRSTHLSRNVAGVLEEATYSRTRATPAMVRVGRVMQRTELPAANIDAALPGCGSLGSGTAGLAINESYGYVHLVMRAGAPTFCGSTPDGKLAQYPVLRHSFVPTAEAIIDPQLALASDWSLHRPDAYEFVYGWPRTIHDLSHQAAYFKRGDSARLIVVAEYRKPEGPFPIDDEPVDIRAHLVMQQNFDAPVRRYTRTGVNRVTFDIPASTQRTVASVEAELPASEYARVRFGSGPGWQAVASDANGVGGVGAGAGAGGGVSDILLFNGDNVLPTTLEDALPMAMSTTRVEQGSQLGIFWEMYGMAAGDTASITLLISQQRSRLSTSLARDSVRSNNETTLSTRWDEPVSSTAAITGRSINVLLQRLRVGTYTLSLAMQKRGSNQPVFESIRTIEIVRPD